MTAASGTVTLKAVVHAVAARIDDNRVAVAHGRLKAFHIERFHLSAAAAAG